MSDARSYAYQASVKSDMSDELINTYVLRPLAGVLVRLLYPTPITPNQVTIAAVLAGLIAAWCYSVGTAGMIVAGGLTVTLKDLLDSADGQLARAKHLYSRAGRFIDSIGDFVVNAAVFWSITSVVMRTNDSPAIPILGLLGFLGISLRVSYHVYYQTSYLHLQKEYTLNRTTEEIREEDRQTDQFALALQNIFQLLYGWQDAMMVRLDRWSRHGRSVEGPRAAGWYGDRMALRLSGFLGLGTELFILMLCSVTNRLEMYLCINVFLLNTLWLSCVVYRRVMLNRRLQAG